MAERGWRRPDKPLVVEGRLYVSLTHGRIEVGSECLDRSIEEWLEARNSLLISDASPRVRVTVECLEPETYA